MDMASFIALLFAKNMALLPLGEPKIGTENDLAPRARTKLIIEIWDDLRGKVAKNNNFPKLTFSQKFKIMGFLKRKCFELAERVPGRERSEIVFCTNF